MADKEELELFRGMLPAIGIGTVVVVGIALLGQALTGRRVYAQDGQYLVSVRYPGQLNDIREFVQPHNPDVVAVCSQYGPDYWALYDFVCRNINYRRDIGEFWQFPCLPPSSHVLGQSSTSIEKLRIGNCILSHSGHEQPISKTMARPYEGPLVELKAARLPPVRLTPEHPVLIIRRLRCNPETLCKRFLSNLKGSCQRCKRYRQWDWEPKFVKVKNVEAGDYVLIPRLKVSKIIDDSLPFKLNHDSCYLLGLFLAEGSTTDHQVQLHFGKHETALIHKAKNIIELLGYKAGQADTGTATMVRLSSKRLAKFLRAEFGAHASEKRIPHFVKVLPPDLIRSFLNGYIDGDGCLVKKRGATYADIATTSDSIVYDILEIFPKIGLVPSVVKSRRKVPATINGRLLSTMEWWNIRVSLDGRKRYDYRIDDDFIYLPVRDKRQIAYRGYVYNLETESHTYCAPFVVHNCETLKGNGDCEDTSILLTSLIRAGGMPALTVLGSLQGYGHAWCEVNGQLLETTFTEARPVANPQDYKRLAAFNDYDVYEAYPGALDDVFSLRRNEATKLNLIAEAIA